MDYEAIGEFIMMVILSLSVLGVAMGFTFKAFLAPVIRDVLGAKRSAASKEQMVLAVRMDQVEERLAGIEVAMHRIAAVEEFNHELKSGSAGENDPAS